MKPTYEAPWKQTNRKKNNWKLTYSVIRLHKYTAQNFSGCLIKNAANKFHTYGKQARHSGCRMENKEMLVNNIHIKEGLDAKNHLNDMFKLCANRKFTKHRWHFSQLKIYNLEYKKWVPSNLSTKQIHIFLRKLCFSSAYTTYNNIIIFWYILAPTESVRHKKQSS